MYMPSGVGGADFLIGVGVMKTNIPLLASNKLLDMLGLVLDLPQSTAAFRALCVTVPVHRMSGHLPVCITDFSGDLKKWQILQRSVDWSDPPPELVVQGDQTQFPTWVLLLHGFAIGGC